MAIFAALTPTPLPDGLEHLALKLQGAVWRDARGKAIRGKALAQLLAAFVRRHLRSAPVPSGLIPADVPEDWRKYWKFGTGDNGDGCLIGVVMVVLALVALTFWWCPKMYADKRRANKKQRRHGIFEVWKLKIPFAVPVAVGRI